MVVYKWTLKVLQLGRPKENPADEGDGRQKHNLQQYHLRRSLFRRVELHFKQSKRQHQSNATRRKNLKLQSLPKSKCFGYR